MQSSHSLTLPVDEDVASVLEDLVDFVLHFLLLGQFQFGDFSDGVDTHARPEDFDLVRIHRCVRDENARVLDTLGHVDADAFFQEEAFFEIRVAQVVAQTFDDLNALEISLALRMRRRRKTHARLMFDGNPLVELTCSLSTASTHSLEK